MEAAADGSLPWNRPDHHSHRMSANLLERLIGVDHLLWAFKKRGNNCRPEDSEKGKARTVGLHFASKKLKQNKVRIEDGHQHAGNERLIACRREAFEWIAQLRTVEFVVAKPVSRLMRQQLLIASCRNHILAGLWPPWCWSLQTCPRTCSPFCQAAQKLIFSQNEVFASLKFN